MGLLASMDCRAMGWALVNRILVKDSQTSAVREGAGTRNDSPGTF